MREQRPVVVIDPGHGGSTATGGSSPNNATGPNGLLEKNLTLDIARRVEQLLADHAHVILTRTGDTNLALADRARVACDNQAAVFLSIHFNGFADAAVDGSETWVAQNAGERSRRFARTVLDQILAVTAVRDRGVRQGDLGVLLSGRHAPSTAACLAEIAFLTNPAQAQRLESEEYRGRIASALAAAVRQTTTTGVGQALAAREGEYAPVEQFSFEGYPGYGAGSGASYRHPGGEGITRHNGNNGAYANGSNGARANGRNGIDQELRALGLAGGMAAGPAFALGRSVGDGGHNDSADVLALKDRLIGLGYNWLARNASMDAPTMRAIRLLQSIVAGRNAVGGDGRVDVPGATYGWLQAANAPRWQIMPAGTAAEGFANDELADTNDQHDYGTDWMAATIRAAAADYRDTYLRTHATAAVLTLNDVSLPQGGDTPDHSGHETGLACDLKLPRTDGRTGGITFQDTNLYDRHATRAILQSLRRQPLVETIYFNDPTLIGEGLCAQMGGHDNHIHFQIRPPARGVVATAMGQGGTALGLTADALAEAVVGMAEGHGSLLRQDFVRRQLEGRQGNSALTAVFDAALRADAAAEQAQRVVREIERQFILDTTTSSLDLLPAAQRDRYRNFAWAENDYPGEPAGPNEGRANEMVAHLSRFRPERRANQGGTGVITEAQLDEWRRQPGNDSSTFWQYVRNEMRDVPGQSPHKLNRHALEAFTRMAANAQADGVTLTIADSDRSPAASQRAAANAGNRTAVARFSSHNLGLAIDFRMSQGRQTYTETTTRPMQNVVTMRQSPVHKWLFLRGAAFGWFPYQHEPWHWEYNPTGFRATFFANWSGRVPGAATQALALGARSVSVQYEVHLEPQPDKLSCWAGAMAMMVSFRQQRSMTAEALAAAAGRSLRTSYGWDMLESVKDSFGFRDIPIPDNVSYVPPPEDWHAWLRQYGPLWVTVRGVPSHAIVVRGLHGDLTPEGTAVDILDPWDTSTRFDNDQIDFHPPNFGRRADGLAYTRFAAEFINISELANVGNWRILYLPPQSSLAQGIRSWGAQALGGGAGILLGYGVPGGRITDSFYRDAAEKTQRTGRSGGRSRHLGMDVSLSSAGGGGADDARRGQPVYAAVRPTLDIAALNQVAVYDNGLQTGLGIPGGGTATLVDALVLRQPWNPDSADAYGGVLGLACRYGYTRRDGSTGRVTIYVEFLHLITDRYLPKNGSGQVITAAEWAATGKGIGFGPRMADRATLTAVELTGGAPLLVGYLGATEFPHVHIQAAYRDGEHGYLRAPRLDPEAVIVPSVTM